VTLDDKLIRLLRSALFVDSIYPGGWRREADLTPEERARAEEWRRFRDRPQSGLAGAKPVQCISP
jgi:hypothetical protein